MKQHAKKGFPSPLGLSQSYGPRGPDIQGPPYDGGMGHPIRGHPYAGSYGVPDDDDLSANNPFRPIANGGIGDQDDFVQNHMDYGDIACHTSFTNGQRDRMRTALTTSRYSLLQSNGCVSPCNDPMTISFTASATAVTIGSNVNFNSTTTGNIST